MPSAIDDLPRLNAMNSPKINKPPSASNTPPPPDSNTLPPPPSLQAAYDQNCLLALRSAGAFNEIEYGTRNINGVSISGIVLKPLNSPFSLDHGAIGVLPLYFESCDYLGENSLPCNNSPLQLRYCQPSTEGTRKHSLNPNSLMSPSTGLVITTSNAFHALAKDDGLFDQEFANTATPDVSLWPKILKGKNIDGVPMPKIQSYAMKLKIKKCGKNGKSSNAQVIHCKMNIVDLKLDLVASFVYGSNDDIARRYLWSNLVA
ncbi:hypothetical protein FF1_019529 [Malus domestica]